MKRADTFQGTYRDWIARIPESDQPLYRYSAREGCQPMQTRINKGRKWAKKETHSSLSVPPTYVCSSRPKTTYAWQAGTQGIQSVQCRVPGGKEMGREELCHANSTYARCQGVRLLVPQNQSARGRLRSALFKPRRGGLILGTRIDGLTFEDSARCCQTLRRLFQ